MANKLPPLPVGVAPGSGYWNDWYEKLRTLVNGVIPNNSGKTTNGIDTTDDIILDGGSLVLKDSANNYWTSSMNVTPTFTYTSGKLTKITYSNGYYKDFTYDGSNRLSTIVYHKGSTVNTKTFNYNGDGTLASVTGAGSVGWANVGTTKP